LQEIPRADWPYVSQLPWVVCSRLCAWEFIETRGSDNGYRANAIQIPSSPPNASYSVLLGEFFRSEYERHVAEALSESGIPFEYERWAFPVKPGVFWTPDFHLPEHKMFVEVKGPWGVSAKSKVKLFTRLFQYTTLLILPWTIHDEFYPQEVGDE